MSSFVMVTLLARLRGLGLGLPHTCFLPLRVVVLLRAGLLIVSLVLSPPTPMGGPLWCWQLMCGLSGLSTGLLTL